MPRTGLAAVAAATLLALLGFASGASADPGDIGFKGPTFAGYSAASGVPPTVSKPQSKLWWNDGFWWAVMWDTDTPRAFHIFKLNAATHAWEDTGTVVDDRNGTVADALWDGSKLYVASQVYVQDSAGAANQSRLYRFSYNAGSDAYGLDAGFPAQINNTSSESLVIDKDSTGQLWATWTQGNPKVVMVNSTQGSDATWGTPFQVSANTITADGISSLVAFGGKIGVMWGDQDTTDKAYYFAIHNDADPDATWSAPEVAIGPASCPGTSNQGCADDHVNLRADSAGRVFAAVKTSLGGASPTNYLLVRTPGGTWVKHLYGTADQQHTRAIVVLDTTNGLARMFATVTEAGGTIYEKTLPLSQADTDGANFTAGLGTPRLVAEDAQGAVMNMNNATSTKQSVSAATGLVVLATNKRATGNFQDYWHHEDSLVGMDTTAPVFQSASVTGSKLTLVYNEVLDGSSVPATGAFAVTVGGVARPVTTVTVSTNAVILRLLSPVIAGEAVTLSYTMPATGPIQDISGNDAASLTNRTATNTTPAGTAFDLIPIGDGTRSGVTANTGATTNLFTFVDDGIATPDDGGTYLHNGATGGGVAQPGHVFLQLTDMPSNFTAMSSMTIDVRVRTQNRVDDDAALLAQLFKADEVTPLSSEVQVALNPGLANWVTVSGIAFTGLVPGTKADWDGARVKLRWLPTAVGTPDSQNRLRVSAAELHATHGTGGGQAPGYLRAFTTPAGAVPGNILLTTAGGSTLLWRNQWATDWMKLAPGVYTIAATAVEGFVPPAPQQITITSGDTTTVDLHYQMLGNLRVILSPAVAGTITIDGDRVNDGGFFAPYPAGSHQVCFGPVAGFDPPACQTVNVAANRASVTTVTGTYTANASAVGETGVGYLRVALQPAGQVPALIYIDGKQRNQWALDWLKLPPGNYTISYSDVEGFRAPAAQQVTITAGQVTILTPQFETLGNLRVRTNPAVPGTITVDGVPINDGSVWTPFAAGQHQVCFGDVPGYTAPPCQTVNVAANRTQLTDITGTYVQN